MRRPSAARNVGVSLALSDCDCWDSNGEQSQIELPYMTHSSNTNSFNVLTVSTYLKLLVKIYYEKSSFFFPVPLRPNAGHGLLILEVF